MYNKLFDVPVPRIVSAEEYFSLRAYNPYRTEAIVQTLKEGDVGDDTCRTTQNKEE